MHKEKLTTVEALSRIASDRLSGSVIVRTALCEERGEFAYRIIMRDAQGRLSTHIVDARTPFAR
ncbi:PepSY domain-containing protein [Hyphomicrobium sp. 1Nfss2.1]|uniref:PepSY domain-containing protein n=1 Tax=Hyphomicrobium sp. 1Nfss2.1 TaxID=3413936 RepID=UPI003C7C7DFB